MRADEDSSGVAVMLNDIEHRAKVLFVSIGVGLNTTGEPTLPFPLDTSSKPPLPFCLHSSQLNEANLGLVKNVKGRVVVVGSGIG